MKNNLRNASIKQNNIVIGGDLKSLLLSIIHHCPLVVNNLRPPSFIERFGGFPDLSPFGLDNSSSKLQLWKRLMYALSVEGMVLNAQQFSTIEISSKESTLTVVSERNKTQFQYNNLYVTDPSNIRGTRLYTKYKTKQKVYDFFNLTSATRKDLKSIQRNDDFINHILFYPSLRDNTHSYVKDICVTSYLTEQQLENHDYSDTSVRLILKRILKENGIRGTKNGLNPNYPDKSDQKYKYRPISIVYENRVVQKELDSVKFTSDNIDYIDMDEEQMLHDYKKLFFGCSYIRRLIC
tara:strand:+ start:673 stop:1554 length:882 start_codon:yes stop_codon:yes gene_type:complete